VELGVAMKILAGIFFLSSGFFALTLILGHALKRAFDVPLLGLVSVFFGAAMYLLYAVMRRRRLS
jgi:hypothetical protein